MIFNCPGSDKFKKPYPENIKCLSCGGEVEIWTDELSAGCPHCGKMVLRHGEQCCLEWCKHARECAGEKIYEDYMRKIRR